MSEEYRNPSLHGLQGSAAALLVPLLAAVFGLDPSTAMLAASPGSADSVAIMAASSNVDLSFAVAMRTARFVLILAL